VKSKDWKTFLNEDEIADMIESLFVPAEFCTCPRGPLAKNTVSANGYMKRFEDNLIQNSEPQKLSGRNGCLCFKIFTRMGKAGILQCPCNFYGNSKAQKYIFRARFKRILRSMGIYDIPDGRLLGEWNLNRLSKATKRKYNL